MNYIKLVGTEVGYIIKRSDRRSISASVNNDGVLEVRAPRRVSDARIADFLKSREDRVLFIIEKSKRRTEYENSLGDEGIKNMRLRAKAVIPERVEYYSRIMEVTPRCVRINAARKRFGSCSAKGNLNFSCRVMAYSAKAVDYVVVHELSHFLHMDHSAEFWKTVERYMPDYREAKKELKNIPK